MEQAPDVKEKRKALAVFWLRMFGWLLTGCGAPITTFAVKFGLFTKTGYEIVYDELGNPTSITTTALNGWGIVSCMLVGFTIIQILKEVVSAYTGYSLTKQILDGILHKIIPLLIAFFICYFISGVVQQMMVCLGVVIVCQIVAIPLNPLPKWKYEKKGCEDYSDAMSSMVKMLKERFKNGE